MAIYVTCGGRAEKVRDLDVGSSCWELMLQEKVRLLVGLEEGEVAGLWE